MANKKTALLAQFLSFKTLIFNHLAIPRDDYAFSQ